MNSLTIDFKTPVSNSVFYKHPNYTILLF